MKSNNKGVASGKTVFALVIFILFLLFLLQNAADVDIRFLFWKITMSRILLLLGSLTTGTVIGVLVGWEWFGRNKKTRIEQNDQQEI
jgi:putative membrane protein